MLKRRVKSTTPKIKVTHKKRVKALHRTPKEPEIWFSQDNTCEMVLSGGIGNIFFKIFFTIAYAMKHGIKYYFSENVRNPHSSVRQWAIPCTGVAQGRVTQVAEQRDENGFPYIQDLPLYQNPVFHGYWQCFSYANPYKKEIFALFDFPKEFNKGLVSIHVRRNDAVSQPNSFPMLLKQYYDDAILYMNNLGHFNFKAYSDDMNFARELFTKENYPNCNFVFQDTETDYDTLMDLAKCEHHVTARSTFSFMGAWICPNENKIVCCPPFPLFKHCHSAIIPNEWVIIDTPINVETPQSWAMHKKTPISFEPLPNKIKIDNLTLLALATRDVEATAKALMYSCKGIDYHSVHLVSPYRPPFFPKEYKWTKIAPFPSINEWNKEVFYNLHLYFDTQYCLFCHADGFVVNSESWAEDFLKYDYIGSPWSHDFSKIIQGGRDQTFSRIGNSVSIRSKKLCEMPTKLGIPWKRINGDYNEDTQTSCHWRREFEEQGIVYADLETACRFGKETEFEENKHIDKPFVFHKWRGTNSKYPKF